MNLGIKSIFLVAKSEYVKWLRNPRFLLVIAASVPVHELIVRPMIRAAGEMGQPLNMFETSIAVANSGFALLLFPLIYLVLIAPFPTADENMLYYIARMGRRNWVLGEMLFQFLSAVSYCIIIIGVTVAQTANISFLENGWSIPVMDYDKMGSMAGIHMGTFIPPNLFYQMPPYKTLFLSYLLLEFFLFLSSMIFLLGCLCGKKLLSLFIVVSQIALGCGLFVTRSAFMWALPFSHSVLSIHYQKYFRKYVFSPWLSLALLCMVLLFVGVMAYRKVQKVSIDMIGGDII